MMAEKKDLDYYKKRFDQLVAAVFDALERMGEELLHAEKDLSHSDYILLEQYLLTKFTRSDLKAALAIGRGELRKELFPPAIRSSKVMSLSPEDQDRLLSDEKFEVYHNSGKVETKTWGSMSPDQRNRLLGPKGGHLHTLREQTKPGAEAVSETVAIYTHVHVVGERLELTSDRVGRRQGRGEIALLHLKDMTPEEWDTIIAQRP